MQFQGDTVRNGLVLAAGHVILQVWHKPGVGPPVTRTGVGP